MEQKSLKNYKKLRIFGKLCFFFLFDFLHITSSINETILDEEKTLGFSPQKGTAVLWYNFKIDEKTGWMESAEKGSWHAGCPIKKGLIWSL